VPGTRRSTSRAKLLSWSTWHSFYHNHARREALRRKSPAKIVAAVPIASGGGVQIVSALADELVCLATPKCLATSASGTQTSAGPETNLIGELLEKQSHIG
jgi:hypothetical protein